MQNHASSLDNAFAPSSRNDQYTAWNFLLFIVDNGLPGVTSSLYITICQGCSGLEGICLSIVSKYVLKGLQSLTAFHNAANGCATYIFLTPTPSLLIRDTDCNSVPNGVGSSICMSLAHLKVFLLRAPSGSPPAFTASSTDDKADAEQCGKDLLKSLSFCSFADLSMPQTQRMSNMKNKHDECSPAWANICNNL